MEEAWLSGKTDHHSQRPRFRGSHFSNWHLSYLICKLWILIPILRGTGGTRNVIYKAKEMTVMIVINNN